jgi:SWIM zinc finger
MKQVFVKASHPISRHARGCRTRSSPGGRRAAGQTLKANDRIARSDRADKEMDFGVGICNEGIRRRDVVIGGVVVAVGLLDADEYEVRAQGTQRYRARLIVGSDGELEYECDCAVGDDGTFCKHAVAVALSCLENAGEEVFDDRVDWPITTSAVSLRTRTSRSVKGHHQILRRCSKRAC